MMKMHMVNNLVIQSAGFEDVDAIVAIDHSSFSSPWTRHMFEVELTENQFGYVFVARTSCQSQQAQQLTGYICFWCIFDELRILNLAVHAQCRRQGIARQLVQFAINHGLSLGTIRALLEVRASNISAVMLYEQCGFFEYGRRSRNYTNPDEDAILMTLDPIPTPTGA